MTKRTMMKMVIKKMAKRLWIIAIAIIATRTFTIQKMWRRLQVERK